MADYKTTKKDFELFKTECKKWVKYFGLIDWEIYYRHDDCDGDSRGQCQVDYPAKLAGISMSIEWDYKPTDFELKRVAFHEVCEIITAPLCVIAGSRFVTPAEVEVANHYIIRILENTIFKK